MSVAYVVLAIAAHKDEGQVLEDRISEINSLLSEDEIQLVLMKSGPKDLTDFLTVEDDGYERLVEIAERLVSELELPTMRAWMRASYAALLALGDKATAEEKSAARRDLEEAMRGAGGVTPEMIKPGLQAYWCDPDGGWCSGPAIVDQIRSESGQIEALDTEVWLTSGTTSEPRYVSGEVYGFELIQPVGSGQ